MPDCRHLRRFASHSALSNTPRSNRSRTHSTATSTPPTSSHLKLGRGRPAETTLTGRGQSPWMDLLEPPTERDAVIVNGSAPIAKWCPRVVGCGTSITSLVFSSESGSDTESAEIDADVPTAISLLQGRSTAGSWSAAENTT